jgi:hypothetical protein
MKLDQLNEATEPAPISKAQAKLKERVAKEIKDYKASIADDGNDATLTFKNFKLKTLVGYGVPRKVVNADFSGNKLTSLEGGPVECDELYNASLNELITIKGAPRKVKYFNADWGRITNLKGVERMFDHCEELSVACNPITSHILGVLLVPGLERFHIYGDDAVDDRIEEIMKKYLPNTKGRAALLDCQEELIDAGFADYAQL